MQLQTNDHVIILDGDKKHFLQVIGRHAASFTGVVDNESKYTDNKQIIQFGMDDVLAILPPIVAPGKAYGLKIEPVNLVGLIQPWGEVVYRRYVTDSEKALVNRTLTHIGRIIHQCRLSSHFPITVEVRPHLSKNDGMYIHTRKAGKLDTLMIMPEQFIHASTDEFTTTSLSRLILHEFAHHIWHCYFTNELRTRWIRLYHHTIQIEESGKDKLLQLHKEFTESNMFVLQYRRSIKDAGEDVELFNTVIKYIIKVHKLTVRHLDILLGEGSKLAEFWPVSPLQLSKVNPVVSQYGTKSADEFFPEAFSFMCVEQVIPAQIANAVNISMKMLGATLPVISRGRTMQAKAA
jgi:hypothetical protein